MNLQTETLTLTIAREVPRQLLADLLCTAVEGGSNYWAAFPHVERDERGDYIAVAVVELEASDEGPAKRATIDHAAMLEGLRRLALATFATAGKHLQDALNEDGDAITADVVLQMAIFGDVIYG